MMPINRVFNDHYQPHDVANQSKMMNSNQDNGKLPDELFRLAGDIDNWNVYKKLAVVCDVTEFFITHHMQFSRTVDQMRQAARSGKQNVVEGLGDQASSFEICYKLLGVARGSLRELREDYKDYLRQNKLTIWIPGDYRIAAWGQYAKGNFEIAEFTSKCEGKRPEAIANIMITLICQLDAALASIMKSLLKEFQISGGIKEKLSQIRLQWRRKNLGY